MILELATVPPIVRDTLTTGLCVDCRRIRCHVSRGEAVSISSVNARIRDVQIEQIPYMFVVSERAAENGTVAVRDRLISDSGQVLPMMEAIAKLNEEVQSRRIRQVVKSAAPAAAAIAGAEATANEY